MDFDLTRETQINHTYHVTIELGNVSRCQLREIMSILDVLEEEGVKILKESHEND